MARPSLYATIKHTRSIQNLKFLLKSLIKDYIPAVLSSRLRSIAELKAYASETSQRYVVVFQEGNGNGSSSCIGLLSLNGTSADA